MSHLILVRHGQSEWNLQNRFTGWVDVDLAPNGKLEACKAGELIKKQNMIVQVFQKNILSFGEVSLMMIDQKLGMRWKCEARAEKKIHEFRRSWDNQPEALNKNSPYHPINIETYKDIPKDKIPDTESLKDTYERVIPFFEKNIKNKMNKNILISAHGNSIRALCKYLFEIDNNKISKLEIPTGNPLILKFSENKKLISGNYLDKNRAKDLIIFS